jgi:hypothetical protein
MTTNSPHHFFSLRVFVGLLIVLTEVVFLNYLAAAGVEVVLSSIVVTVALLIQLRFAVREDVATPADIAVFVFNWLFLDLAPKIQLIGTAQQLVNTSSVSVGGVAVTTLVCALFMITFTLVYGYLSRRSSVAATRIMAASPALPAASVMPAGSAVGGTSAAGAMPAVGAMPARPTPERNQFTGAAVALAIGVCVLMVGVAAPYAYKSVDAPVTSPVTLIVNRFLLFVPSATFLILLNETIRGRHKLQFSRVCAIALLILLVFATENPYTEKRNALGPLYLGLVLIAFQDWFASRTRRMLLLVGSMVIGFPAISVFTHNHKQTLGTLSMSDVASRIQEHYFSINYDSWANVYTSVEIVKVHGPQWGKQLLGSLLFFVPSSIWTTKPLATGIFLGNYLISSYSMWFNNLSAPLAAEGYLDFGYVGVIAYASATAALVTLINKLALKENRLALPMAIYASLFLMFLLRGSLMIAMGFASAAFLSFCLASAMLSMRLGVRRGVTASRPIGSHPTMAS